MDNWYIYDWRAKIYQLLHFSTSYYIPIYNGDMSKSELEEGGASGTGVLFTQEMRTQLETVFERMENPLVLRLYLDNRPVSKELQECTMQQVRDRQWTKISASELSASESRWILRY